MIEFTFERAYDLKSFKDGFACKLMSNQGNTRDLFYTFTEEDAKLSIDEIAIREIKEAWESFKVELDKTIPDNAVVDAEGNITIDNSEVVEEKPEFTKDYVTAEDIRAGKMMPATSETIDDTLPTDRV